MVIGPPEGCCLLLSLRVRSGLIASQCTPPSVVLNRLLAGVVERFGIVRRDHDRRSPLEAMLEDAGAARVGQMRSGW